MNIKKQIKIQSFSKLNGHLNYQKKIFLTINWAIILLNLIILCHIFNKIFMAFFTNDDF